MTREEKIEMVEAILGPGSILPTAQVKAYAQKIVDALDPPSPLTYRNAFYGCEATKMHDDLSFTHCFRSGQHRGPHDYGPGL